MMYDALILGGGAAGMSCALVLGSARGREYVAEKKIGLIAHQKSSHLQNALFNNVLGIKPGTTGEEIMESGLEQINDLYPQIELIKNEKAMELVSMDEGFKVVTNKAEYMAKIVVVAFGYTNLLSMSGLEEFIEDHPRAVKEKNRIWLKNDHHLVKDNLYVAGTLAGWRSQFAMASGSGAHVATDILTLWNGGKHTKVHDKVPS